ncbi:hypothetical protein EYF80_032055 [Liparis tanakae]|uniref:Uncharacterized protein n=1 Tax=Liparis tanakae TaxID=230148 RepID=A0A4Z2GVY3_9TELE|nr:hypothetical protein EYF80_032055 [Liparis tanakae]
MGPGGGGSEGVAVCGDLSWLEGELLLEPVPPAVRSEADVRPDAGCQTGNRGGSQGNLLGRAGHRTTAQTRGPGWVRTAQSTYVPYAPSLNVDGVRERTERERTPSTTEKKKRERETDTEKERETLERLVGIGGNEEVWKLIPGGPNQQCTMLKQETTPQSHGSSKSCSCRSVSARHTACWTLIQIKRDTGGN